MDDYFDNYIIECNPKTNDNYVVVSGRTRLSLITDSLLRVENSENSLFCDEPTQAVWFRSFSAPSFQADTKGDFITITTPAAEFCVNSATGKVKYIKLCDGRTVTDFSKGNLKGTRRTLDRTTGKARIGDGIISENGVAVLSDSDSLLIAHDGTIKQRSHTEKDDYYFAYGKNYTGAVADFLSLTGRPPLVPRFALGNWWSRYKAYTQDEYISLMSRFIDEEIPITVATIDMDWHWTDVDKRFGKSAAQNENPSCLWERIYDAIFKGGWTGYSWNTELFPDPDGFLKWLKDKNYKVTMNLHPATGVRWFEDNYGSFADFMGIDRASRKQIPFDITDKKFTEGYFRFMHHPLEDKGVDFWWIDWQQGTKTKTPGLDPLWALNHYHSLDSARNGKRPLILSRFAGAGSHRYPLGFSGDTAQTWPCLDFQPYFTSTASNIGYTWWSHDIGGHHFGIKDDELYLRWVQFGVFSPIMRLHSTSNEFMGKEPWKYSGSTRRIVTDALRLRHRLIPYIYTMNYRTHTEGRALIEPMYYHNPDSKDAYNCPNTYYFGSELIAAPITEKKNSKSNLAHVRVWLPKGRYTDIFTGRIYIGGKTVDMYRDETSIPVFAKEGAIIPLSVNDRTNNCDNPEELEVLVYRGEGSFTLYEDDGETLDYQNGACAFTKFTVTQGSDCLYFTIHTAEGDLNIIPMTRNYTLSFRDITTADNISVNVNGDRKAPAYAGRSNGHLSVALVDVKPSDSISVSLEGVTVLQNADTRESLIELISDFQGKNNPKAKKYTDFVNGKADKPHLPSCLALPIEEIQGLWKKNEQ